MNADELKKADEIARNLREGEHVGYESQYQMHLAASDLIDSLTAQLTESERREKAAVEDINLLEDCSVCKHHDLDSCDLAGTKCHFEWRGPQAEERSSRWKLKN